MELDDSYSSDSIDFEDQDEDYQPLSFTDNDLENQKFIGDKTFNNLPLSPTVKQYFEKFKKSTPKAFIKLFNLKDQVEQHKSVCAKPIERGSTIAQCYDCATDSSCIQCMECFKNSNHQGHKVVIKKAYGGCCDCGDVEAWKKQGFCKNHTGEVVDIQIDAKQQDNFIIQMKQLFFLMFWQSIQQNTNHCREYSKKLLQSLCYLNERGVYYNKLTCMVFGSKIPQNLIVSKNVNNRTILANILSPKVGKNLNIDEWMDLFFSMFQYYPFKKLLLSTYMKNFSVIYGDQQSQMRGSSISCQLLTSYQLVRQYALEANNVPLGSDINIDKIPSFQRPFYMMYHDLEYITKLSGDTPQVYFKFHMTSKQGILKLFEYRKVIKKLQDKQKDEPDILQLARFVKYFQIQFKVMEIVSKIAGILQKDKQTLQIVIKTLFEQALKEQTQRKMIIFKPLTRALAINLFAYFDLDLKNLDYSNNHEKIDRLVKILSNNGTQFGKSISNLFKICMQSFLFHAKTLAEPGLNSTLYVYIFLYKMKNRLVSSVDILNIKMLSMIHNWPQVNKQPVVSPQDYLWQNRIAVTRQAKKQQLESEIQNLQFILLQLNLVTASQSNQLYVAYDINPECGLYQDYIEKLLLKILKQQKGSVTLATVKQYEDSFFHKNVDLAHLYLKKFCNFDKAKKSFILNKQYEQDNENSHDSLNYSDFRCNLTNKSDFQSPQKTLELIKQSRGQFFFNSLWSVQTIKKFAVKALQFMKALKEFEQSNESQSNSLYLEKLKPLFVQLMKIIYLKRQMTSKPQQLQILFEFLRKVQNINLVINPFYDSLIYPQKIQEEKPSQFDLQANQKFEISPKKPSLESKKSSQQQRKKRIKEKMEQKKKSIRQRYATQLVKFEQQEKNKLQKQEQEEMNVHKLNCIICKNDTQTDLVYFVHISYQNHQRLLNLGDGVTCLSIQSCYHAVDFACYEKLASEVGHKKRPVVKCPFCKFRSNTFFPILSSSKHSDEAIKKFEVAIFLQKNIDQISILEQIVKSFYHFALLAYLDPQRTLHRRLKIYRIILQILKANSKVYSVSEVYHKFITKTMNLNPKIFEEEQQLKRSERLLQLSMLLQNSEQGMTIQDLSQDQIQHLLQIIGQNSNSSSEGNNNTGFFGNIVNKIKEKLTPSKNKEQQEEPQISQNYTTIFKETLMRLFKFLGIKQMPIEQEKSQKMSQKPNQERVSMIEQELSPQLQICLKRLFDEKIPHQIQHHNNIYEDFNQNNALLKLRDLPLNFKPLGRLNKCFYCEQITASMTLCLICDWQGCLKNCLTSQKKIQRNKENEKGGSFNHSRIHGQQSLFLLMQKCLVAKITSEGTCQTMGCIYKDEWGNDFDNKKPWQSFFLDEGELNKIKISFLHQQ